MKQNQDFRKILYTDSPFLPSVTTQSLETIRNDYYLNNLPLPVAIAKEVTLEAIKQNEIQEDNFDWIADTFNTSVQNLDDFFTGFVTPPTLIIGGYTLKTHSIKDVIRLYCPPTEDQEIINHNRYKVRHLFDSNRFIESCSHHHPITIAQPIFDLCKTDVFKNDWYYLAGIHASETLFNRFSRQFFLQ